MNINHIKDKIISNPLFLRTFNNSKYKIELKSSFNKYKIYLNVYIEYEDDQLFIYQMNIKRNEKYQLIPYEYF